MRYVQQAHCKTACMATASLLCRVHAEQGTITYKFDQVVNEDAGLDFTYQYTAQGMVDTARREGGSGCFISLGLPGSGKTFLLEVTMHLPSPTSTGYRGGLLTRAPDTSPCYLRWSASEVGPT